MALQLPLDRALAATNSGIVIADATVEGFPLTYINAAFERLTGYAASECIGRNCRFLQGRRTDPAAVAELSRALREGEDSRSVLLNYRKDGSTFQNELRLAPVTDERGRVVQIIGVQNDVTEIVRQHEAILAERDRARVSLQRATQVIARQDQELAELRALQEALTPPRPPARPHLSLASCFLPAEEGVAGDFYLVAAGPGDATILAVGDVMGHGLQAARRATFVRAALATFSRFTDDPLRLLEMANHSLIERIGTSAEFVTAVCASYRPSAGRLQWAAAGHPAPIALDSGEPVGRLTKVGAPLGIEIDLGGSRSDVDFLPGQGLLLYTDGLPEARCAPTPRSRAPRLGDDRVRDLVRHLPGEEPQRIVDCLRAEAVAHTGGTLADDLCLVALRADLSAAVDPADGEGLALRLELRPPFDGEGLLAFLARRAVPGVEEVSGGGYRRSVRLPHGAGTVELRPAGGHVDARLRLDDPRDAVEAVRRARGLFDLDADPGPIAAALGGDPVIGPLVRASPGRRVPGTTDGHELAIRAVLGQQVSVAGARTLAARLVAAHGRPLARPSGAVTHVFPAAGAVAGADPASLAMPWPRRRALLGLAAALAGGDIDLAPGADAAETRRRLRALPGIGPWTVEYVAMRALGDRDAFLPTDLGVRHALARLGHDGSPAAALRAAERWRPYRAYALVHLWAALGTAD